MNVRISQGQLRFRITRGELDGLLQDKTVELILPLVGQFQNFRIRCESLKSLLALQEYPAGLTLLVDHGALEVLEKKLPSREGIEQQITLKGESLLLILEVDVRKSLGHQP